MNRYRRWAFFVFLFCRPHASALFLIWPEMNKANLSAFSQQKGWIYLNIETHLQYPLMYVVTQRIWRDFSWSGVKTSVWPNDNGTVTDHQSTGFRFQLGVELPKCCGDFLLQEGDWKRTQTAVTIWLHKPDYNVIFIKDCIKDCILVTVALVTFWFSK